MTTGNEIPQRIKRALRELAGVANEREMARELDKLASYFDAWRAGQAGVWELKERIHQFHNGAARDLYNKYEESWADLLVADAVKRGILRKDELPSEVWPYVQPRLAFLASIQEPEQDEEG